MNNKKEEIGQSVLKGSLILVIANLLVKIIGALFKIPLTNLLGNEGMGYFNSAYTIYSSMFTIATAGLPVAIAKMIAESTAHGNLNELKRIHRVSYAIFAFVGIVGTAVLFFGADFFAKDYGETAICIRMVAPALFFVAIMSVYRGFFQGLSDMYPTAFSELIESGTKLVLGFIFAFVFLKYGLVYGATGAISGVTLGSVFGAIFLILMFMKKKSRIYASLDASKPAPSTWAVFKKLIYVALPVTISASVFTITYIIDYFQIGKRLSKIALLIPKEQIANVVEKAADMTDPQKITTSLYGMYTSKALTMLNLLPALVVAICLPLVPAIARAYESKKMGIVSNTTRLSIKFTMIFAMPGAVGIGVLADPILRCLFGTNDASLLLKLIVPAIVCVSVVLVTNSILQATGNVLVPVINIAIAAVTKVIVNFTLLGIPKVNINGVAIGTSACYIVYMTLNLFYVIKITKPGLTVKDFIIKPVISTGIMGVVVWAVNTALTGILGTSRMAAVICTGGGIAVGGIVYVIALFKTHSLSASEIINLPKGDKICTILKKIRLL